jgi:hypothetical protein
VQDDAGRLQPLAILHLRLMRAGHDFLAVKYLPQKADGVHALSFAACALGRPFTMRKRSRTAK